MVILSTYLRLFEPGFPLHRLVKNIDEFLMKKLIEHVFHMVPELIFISGKLTSNNK